MGRCLAILDAANHGRCLAGNVPGVVQFGVDGAHDHPPAVKVQDEGEGVVGPGIVRAGARHGRCITTTTRSSVNPHHLGGGGTERRGGDLRPGRVLHEEPGGPSHQDLHVPRRPGEVVDLNGHVPSPDGIDGGQRREDLEDVVDEILLPRPPAEQVGHIGGAEEEEVVGEAEAERGLHGFDLLLLVGWCVSFSLGNL